MEQLGLMGLKHASCNTCFFWDCYFLQNIKDLPFNCNFFPRIELNYFAYIDNYTGLGQVVKLPFWCWFVDDYLVLYPCSKPNFKIHKNFTTKTQFLKKNENFTSHNLISSLFNTGQQIHKHFFHPSLFN